MHTQTCHESQHALVSPDLRITICLGPGRGAAIGRIWHRGSHLITLSPLPSNNRNRCTGSTAQLARHRGWLVFGRGNGLPWILICNMIDQRSAQDPNCKNELKRIKELIAVRRVCNLTEIWPAQWTNSLETCSIIQKLKMSFCVQSHASSVYLLILPIVQLQCFNTEVMKVKPS